MKNKILLFWIIIIMLMLFQIPCSASVKEKWNCTIDFSQGGSGTFELNREDTHIEGMIVIIIGQNRTDNAIEGQWIDKNIEFKRVLSKKSSQPYKGTVTSIRANKMKMEGQYGAAYKASWSSECELLERKQIERLKAAETTTAPTSVTPPLPPPEEKKVEPVKVETPPPPPPEEKKVEPVKVETPPPPPPEEKKVEPVKVETPPPPPPEEKKVEPVKVETPPPPPPEEKKVEPVKVETPPPPPPPEETKVEPVKVETPPPPPPEEKKVEPVKVETPPPPPPEEKKVEPVKVETPPPPPEEKKVEPVKVETPPPPPPEEKKVEPVKVETPPPPPPEETKVEPVKVETPPPPPPEETKVEPVKVETPPPPEEKKVEPVKVETPPPPPPEETKPALSKTESVAPPVVPTKPAPPKTEPGVPPEITPPVASMELLQKASEAKWTNGSQDLAFHGDASSRKGFVRYVENAQLENFVVAHKVLETCPQLQPGGFIEGRIANVTIPESGAEFHSSIGFLKGSKDTEGVFFEVRGEFPEYRGIPVRREYFKPYNESLVNDFVQDLSQFKGLKGTLVLSVTAGLESSEQNWAIWVEPRVVPLEKEGKGPVFVGGAVGSGQDGNKLLNAWGGKSGALYGDVAVYLLFANVDKAFTVRLDSYRNGMFVGSTDFGNIKKGQTEIWQTLYRTMQGEWRERVMLNGIYAGDLRYTVSKSAEQ